MTSELKARAEAIIAGMSKKQLVDAFVEIVSRPRSPANKSVRIWLIDEMESRFETLSDQLEAYYESGIDDGLTYDERVIKIVTAELHSA